MGLLYKHKKKYKKEKEKIIIRQCTIRKSFAYKRDGPTQYSVEYSVDKSYRHEEQALSECQILKVVKKKDARKRRKKKETKKKRGNGRYTRPFITLAKITSLPPRTIIVQ